MAGIPKKAISIRKISAVKWLAVECIAISICAACTRIKHRPACGRSVRKRDTENGKITAPEKMKATEVC